VITLTKGSDLTPYRELIKNSNQVFASE
jgi:hypothetical protein